jgi:hypothetical protein
MNVPHYKSLSAVGLSAAVTFGLLTTAAQGEAPEKPLSSENWSYPESLDAANAAPSTYKVLFDDVAVRLLEVTLGPGQHEGKHADRWPAVLIYDTPPGKTRRTLENGKTAKLDASKDKTLDGPLPLMVRVTPLGPHADQNLDTTAHHFYKLEFKQLKFEIFDGPNGPYSASGQLYPAGSPIQRKPVVDDPTPQFADPDHWPYPMAMDSYLASPEAHTLRFQDARVRFVEVLGHPFHREGMHDHRYPTVFINDTPGPKVVDDHYDGTVVVHSPHGEPPPLPETSAHSPDLPHAGMNIDDHDGHFYRLEFKTFRFQYYDTDKGRVRVSPSNEVNATVLTTTHMPARLRQR